MTRKNRKTHLLGFSSLMSLRESTIPQISHTLRQQPDLPQRLKLKVEQMIEAAKRDVEDFYEEITFRRERKSGGGQKSGEKRNPNMFFKPKNRGQPKDEEEEEEKDQEEVQEEEERDTHINTPNFEEEEEGSDDEKSDGDIFRGRFSSQTRPKLGEPPKPAVPADPGLMAKTLKEMITQAVHCGALAEESRLHKRMKQIQCTGIRINNT